MKKEVEYADKSKKQKKKIFQRATRNVSINTKALNNKVLILFMV